MTHKPSGFAFEVNFSLANDPELYKAWLSEKSTLKLKEIATIFDWDVKEGKIKASEESFNNYLLKRFNDEVAFGWSIAEKIDPIKLLPLEIQAWHHDLPSYNQRLLWDAYLDQNQNGQSEFADYLRKIYNNKNVRTQWETAIPEADDIETSCAASEMLWLIEDDGGFDNDLAYYTFCMEWKKLSFDDFKKELTESLKNNLVFEQQFKLEWAPDYEGLENNFLDNIDFRYIYDFMQNDFNKWPENPMQS